MDHGNGGKIFINYRRGDDAEFSRTALLLA